MSRRARRGFEVTGWVDRVGGWVARHTDRWIALGNAETRLLADRLDGVEVVQPIYVAGLARSGSTILLETLARHPAVATHRYRDYPFLFTPYAWNRWLDRLPRRAEPAVERSHGDGIAVTSESPEAFEEVLWMAFYPDLHHPGRSAVLGRATRHPAFEAFYRDHIRKLLLARGASRYLSKGNYNLTRLGYLQAIFPDARFVVPLRDPVWHVASLMKQHDLFLAGQAGNPKALRHLQRIGHFEFGLDRRPVDPGEAGAVGDVLELWRRGEELRGWARYWALLHRHLAELLERDAALRQAVLLVPFETLCSAPLATITELFAHCRLPAEDAELDASAAQIRFPTYYEPRFTGRELAVVAEETGAARRRLAALAVLDGAPAVHRQAYPGHERRVAGGQV